MPGKMMVSAPYRFKSRAICKTKILNENLSFAKGSAYPYNANPGLQIGATDPLARPHLFQPQEYLQ
jgi:hypothetical protein